MLHRRSAVPRGQSLAHFGATTMRVPRPDRKAKKANMSALRRHSFMIQHMGECCFIGEIRKSEAHQLHFLNALWRPTIVWLMSLWRRVMLPLSTRTT